MRRFMLCACIALLLTVSTVGAQDPFGSTYDNGVLTLDFFYIDDLLKLGNAPDLRIIEVTGSSEAAVSSAHLHLLLGWVNQGGILWFHQTGFWTSLSEKVNPGVEIVDVGIVEKESGARFSKSVGELFVRDLLPWLTIAEHRITSGVKMLYVKVGRNPQTITQVGGGTVLTPIIYFRSNAAGLAVGNPEYASQDIVLFAIAEKGSGLIILDTTKIGGRDWDGPDGNVYDASRFYENIKSFQ